MGKHVQCKCLCIIYVSMMMVMLKMLDTQISNENDLFHNNLTLIVFHTNTHRWLKNTLTAYRLTYVTCPLVHIELCQVSLYGVHTVHCVLNLTGLETEVTAHCGHTYTFCVYLFFGLSSLSFILHLAL